MDISPRWTMVHRRFSSAFYHAVSGMYVTTIPRDKLPWSYNNWRGISEDLKTFRGILLKFKTKETSNQIKVKYHEQPLRSQSKKKTKLTKSRLVSVLNLIGWQDGTSFLSQSNDGVKQNQRYFGSFLGLEICSMKKLISLFAPLFFKPQSWTNFFC